MEWFTAFCLTRESKAYKDWPNAHFESSASKNQLRNVRRRIKTQYKNKSTDQGALAVVKNMSWWIDLDL